MQTWWRRVNVAFTRAKRGLVVLEALTGLPVSLAEAHGRRRAVPMPSTKERSLLGVWAQELHAASSATLRQWLDVEWAELPLTMLHRVVGMCLVERRKDRHEVSAVTATLKGVCDLMTSCDPLASPRGPLMVD